MTWINKEINFSNPYGFEVRSLYWNGDYTIAPDGTISIPYRTGSSKNTDNYTHICTRIDGNYNNEIGWKDINLNGGTYSFNLDQIGNSNKGWYDYCYIYSN